MHGVIVNLGWQFQPPPPDVDWDQHDTVLVFQLVAGRSKGVTEFAGRSQRKVTNEWTVKCTTGRP